MGGSASTDAVIAQRAAPRRKYPWGALLHGHLFLAVFCETQQALLANKLDELLRRDGAADQVALQDIAAVLGEKRRLRLGFDALGDDGDAECLRHLDHRRNDRGILRIIGELLHELLVDLQDADLEALEVAER